MFCRVVCLCLCFLIVGGCTTVDFTVERSVSKKASYQSTANTTLAKEVDAFLTGKDGLNAFYPLDNGMDALGVRLNLAETAEQTIDVQTFLMKDDTASMVMCDAFLKAADRGVKIRFLLDDIFTTTPDKWLALLGEHKNIEVRLFNPISRKGIDKFNFIGHFDSANRRMHNKSFTVDNHVSVVGGRNIADEYYQLNTDNMFTDFDVLAAGPIADDISQSFDEFWNHERSIPAQYLISLPGDLSLVAVRQEIDDLLEADCSNLYKQSTSSETLKKLMADNSLYYLASAKLMTDNPANLFVKNGEDPMTLTRDMREVLRSAKQEVTFITPYFVPGDAGVELLKELVNKGVAVNIITNSLASNNHIPVQSAYSQYRKKVIEAGGNIYEIRVNATSVLTQDKDAPKTMTLHTKVIMIDRQYLFAGSLNLDPRSTQINTEMGLLINNKVMTSALAEQTFAELPAATYRVVVNEKGKTEWHGEHDGEEVIYFKEPQTSAWKRFKAWFMRIAPENQL